MTTPILPAGTGLSQTILGMTHINKLLPEAGLGLIIEVTAPPGHGAPLHTHETDTEAFYMLDGELTVECDGHTGTLRPGDMCLLPAGSAHAFRNESGRDARFLAVVTPGTHAFAFFSEVDRAGATGGLTPDMVIALGTAQGLVFAAPA